jgi:hypothetical protein
VVAVRVAARVRVAAHAGSPARNVAVRAEEKAMRMTYRSLKSRWWQVVLGATLLVVLLGQPAWAQTREDFNKLDDRC